MSVATETLNAGQYLGRQMIVDKHGRVRAYEILYRGDGDRDDPSWGDRATMRVVLGGLVDAGLERLTDGHTAFINLTESLLLDTHLLEMISPRKVVLEVLEDVPASPAVLQALRSLRSRGFSIALDDYVWTEDRKALIQYADYVKIDIQEHSRDELDRQVLLCRDHGIRLLAEKVETREEFDLCRELGFERFQGFFCSRPELVGTVDAQPYRINTLRLMALLSNPDAEIDEVESLVRRDVRLTHRLLRVANSALFAPAFDISSVREMVMWLGIRRVQQWIGIMALVGMDNRVSDVSRAALVRARMCERLAEHLGLSSDVMFTVGLLSVIDVLTGQSIQSAVSELPLDAEVVAALLHREGKAGDLLTSVLAHEVGDWEGVEHVGLSADAVNAACLEALDWCREVCDVGIGSIAPSARNRMAAQPAA